jgi:hypothetical protein
VPTATFVVYVTVTGALNPPTPVAVAMHGVCAAPVYITEAGHVSVTNELAVAMEYAPGTDEIA